MATRRQPRAITLPVTAPTLVGLLVPLLLAVYGAVRFLQSAAVIEMINLQLALEAAFLLTVLYIGAKCSGWIGRQRRRFLNF